MNTLELLRKAKEANDKALVLGKMGLYASAKALQAQAARWVREAETTSEGGRKRPSRTKGAR